MSAPSAAEILARLRSSFSAPRTKIENILVTSLAHRADQMSTREAAFVQSLSLSSGRLSEKQMKWLKDIWARIKAAPERRGWSGWVTKVLRPRDHRS
jgi:hypothetical protein